MSKEDKNRLLQAIFCQKSKEARTQKEMQKRAEKVRKRKNANVDKNFRAERRRFLFDFRFFFVDGIFWNQKNASAQQQ